MPSSQATTYYLKLRWFLIIGSGVMLAMWAGAMLPLFFRDARMGLRIAGPLLVILPLGALSLLAQALTYRVTVSPAGIEARYFAYRFAAAWEELARSEIDSPALQWLVLRQPPAGLPRVWLFATPEHLRGRAIPIVRALRGAEDLQAQLRAYAPQLFAGFDPAAGLAVPAIPGRRRVSRPVVAAIIGVTLLNWLWMFWALRGF